MDATKNAAIQRFLEIYHQNDGDFTAAYVAYRREIGLSEERFDIYMRNLVVYSIKNPFFHIVKLPRDHIMYHLGLHKAIHYATLDDIKPYIDACMDMGQYYVCQVESRLPQWDEYLMERLALLPIEELREYAMYMRPSFLAKFLETMPTAIGVDLLEFRREYRDMTLTYCAPPIVFALLNGGAPYKERVREDLFDKIAAHYDVQTAVALGLKPKQV